MLEVDRPTSTVGRWRGPTRKRRRLTLSGARFAWLSILFPILLCEPAAATIFEYQGITYDSVNWTTADPSTEIATGTAAGTSVTVNAVDVWDGVIHTDDFSTDTTSYGALGLAAGTSFETFKMTGGVPGTTTLIFGQPVSSVLVIVGRPNSFAPQDQWGRGSRDGTWS